MKQKYIERQAQIEIEQIKVQELLNQQVLATMNGDPSFIYNSSISRHNKVPVQMLMGGKIQFSERSKSLAVNRISRPPTTNKKKKQDVHKSFEPHSARNKKSLDIKVINRDNHFQSLGPSMETSEASGIDDLDELSQPNNYY